jgi:hypothetical protein
MRFSRRWLWRMASSGMLRRVALVGTDGSEEHSTSVIRVRRIGELGTLVVTSNRRTLRRKTPFFLKILINNSILEQVDTRGYFEYTTDWEIKVNEFNRTWQQNKKNVNMKRYWENAIKICRYLWRMPSSGMLRCVARVRTDVLQELSVSIHHQGDTA